MESRTCKQCHNFICQDMNPLVKKEYIALCLNQNRRFFIPHSKEDEEQLKERSKGK